MEKNYCSTNTLLQSRYVVGLAMGSNELGITYDGCDNVTNKKVAIKEFFPSGIASRENNIVSGTGAFATGLQQFVKEANILKENKGLASIVEVFDVVEENGTAYVVMEYIEGTSLEEVVKGNRLFPIKRMLDLMEPLLKSLYALHEAGLLHQNISPDNLIFTNDGALKLVGFGCLDGVVSEKSKGYAPIELYRQQEEKKPSTDIYALCATIYRCITGKTPVDAMDRLNNEELELPSSMGIEISEVQEAVISMGMSVYAEKRLQGIQALYRALYGNVMTPVKPVQPTPQPTPVQPAPQPTPVQAAPVQPAPQPTPVQAAPVQPAPQPTPVQAAPVQPAPQPAPVQSTSETVLVQPMQMPVQPIAAPMDDVIVPPQSTDDNKKKEKGNAGLVIAICVGLVLVVALGISAFILAQRVLPGSFMAGNTKTEVETEEETTEVESTEVEETSKLQEVKDALAVQNYEGVIDMVLSLSAEDKEALDETELTTILKQAVDGKKNAIMAEVDGYVNNGSYDEAFTAISGGIQYLESIAANEAVTSMADSQVLKDKETEVKQKHKDYLFTTAESCANKADETGMEDALTKLSSYITTEEVEAERTKCYGKLVIATMTQMRNNGSGAQEILTYINDNLKKTGNNCWVLEFWDYYNTVYAMESGKGITTDTTIKHVSNSGYLLDDSNSVNLTNDDIKHLTEYEIYLALYEIYARHGRGFNDASVTSYFSQYSWYQETTRPEAFDESALNEYEKHNRDLIIEYQYTMGYR